MGFHVKILKFQYLDKTNNSNIVVMATDSYLSQERVIWLILDGHEHDEDSVEQLDALQCSNTHVQEHTKEYGHGDFTKDWCHDYRQSNQSENNDVRQTVFPVNTKQKKLHSMPIKLEVQESIGVIIFYNSLSLQSDHQKIII